MDGDTRSRDEDKPGTTAHTQNTHTRTQKLNKVMCSSLITAARAPYLCWCWWLFLWSKVFFFYLNKISGKSGRVGVSKLQYHWVILKTLNVCGRNLCWSWRKYFSVSQEDRETFSAYLFSTWIRMKGSYSGGKVKKNIITESFMVFSDLNSNFL